MTLSEALGDARRAVVDTMVFIYYFEDHPQYGAVADEVLREAGTGRFEALVTPITVAELLVKPLRAERQDVADQYRSAMRHLGGTSTTSLSWQAGCLAGALRARYGLPLPDMLQVAVAIEAGSCAVITNDSDLRRVEEVSVVLLDELQA